MNVPDAAGPELARTTGDEVVWRPGGLLETLRRPLPHRAHSISERVLCRLIVALSRRTIIEIRGLENVRPELDPFLLVMNHSQRAEAILVPVVLIYARGGGSLHFLGDWNFQMIPGVGFLYRRSGLITVVRKDARPRFLNVFKRFFDHPLSASERALLTLERGGSVGVFPEGTVNRDPARLLPGRSGAARLSIEAQVPVVPGGVRFPEKDPQAPIRDFDRMALRLGAPMTPPADDGSREVVASWHHQIMTTIARLCGKTWQPARERS